MSRAGKATGKYKHCLNVQNTGEDVKTMDWEHEVQKWRAQKRSASLDSKSDREHDKKSHNTRLKSNRFIW